MTTPQKDTTKNKKQAPSSSLIPEELQRIQELEEQLSQALEKNEQLSTELGQSKEKELRALADLQNVRRRTEEQRGNLLFESGKQILLAFLPTLDNFDLAFQNLPNQLEENEWVKGVLSLEKNMYEVLKKEGLEEISEENVPLDPHIHEAVMIDPDGEQGKVSKILQKGYMFQNKVLRPAKVSVGPS